MKTHQQPVVQQVTHNSLFGCSNFTTTTTLANIQQHADGAASKRTLKSSINMMASTSSRAASSSPQKRVDRSDRTNWTTATEKALIASLAQHKSESADGSNFKSSTWTAVASEVFS